MSYVEIVILRHLFAGPVHGYELRKRIEMTVGLMLNNNTLYPALRRFEEAGAVTKTAEQQESRPPRHVYALTELGRELLHDMLAELPADEAGNDTEFLTRLGQFQLLTPAERSPVLTARDEAICAHLERLRMLRERAGGERWGQLVTEELIRRNEAERAWLATLRDEARRP
ncbi:MAG: PadR family transcriptional regulator [Mycobacterium sp.]|jgi:DNA-binding PadR family transcriptional regulator|uniref:PadR family transcriptional regulator n=1 Tax=Mycobacterium sp. TaxID=1785 RepID=UPI002840EFE0|nr:PadR family transcriptional regulator [Mycobacterium sp.]